MNTNRKRTIQMKFWATEEERKMIRQKMYLSKTANMGAYLRKMAIDGIIANVDTTYMRKQFEEMHKIGVNVNQMAKVANTTGSASPEDILKLKKMLDDIWRLLRSSTLTLGIITSMLSGLLLGAPVIQLKGMPDPASGLVNDTIFLITNYQKWGKENLISTEKGLLLFAAPYFAKIMLSRINEIEDMSMIKGVLLGGAKMQKEELDEMEVVFGKKGLRVPICNGYGQNEMAGAVALNTIRHNKNGSAGYPVYGTEIRIVDKDSLEDVPYNAVGKILEASESSFLEYLEMPEKTDASKIILPDGTTWYDSTDLGYMDEEGFLFITGRTTRVVIRTDHKISLDVIEEKIKKLSIIHDAAVIANVKRDREWITAYVSLETNLGEVEVEKMLKSEMTGLSEFEIPDQIRVIKELPRMNNGKIDYNKLNYKS